MDSVIYNPLEEYEKKYRQKHLDATNVFFEKLVQESGVDIEANRTTVKRYNTYKENLKKLRRKYNIYRFLRVLAIITLVLIPLVLLKLTPTIKKMREDIQDADKKTEELLAEAYSQMEALNRRFTHRDALNIIQEVVSLMKFHDSFSVKQETDMKINFDLSDSESSERSTIDVLSGEYNGNPFLFENKKIHTMGTETYHGYKTISWTEIRTDSNGKRRTVTRTQTLHATVVKPKPFYSTQVVLSYGSQAAPDLSFTRDATYLDKKSEREIKRHIKKGEKSLKKKTDKAIEENRDFVSMSNTEFEVLFDALDRTNEVQFRTLFTPLAQTNFVDLILSKIGYGDDFNFIKTKRMNTIITSHSQSRAINLEASEYTSYSFDIIKSNFVTKNTEFFKAVYFDFAPLLAIPAYSERPVHSLKPIPDYTQLYSLKECEALANIMDKKLLVHPNTKTQAILKAEFFGSEKGADKTGITAYSYDIFPQVDFVPVFGGDGRFHNVPVSWDEYVPLEQTNKFFVTRQGTQSNVIASRKGLCIYN